MVAEGLPKVSTFRLPTVVPKSQTSFPTTYAEGVCLCKGLNTIQLPTNHGGTAMKITLAEPSYLKESISVISDLVSEGRFKITPNGLELVAMDPANVAMVIFNLLSSCFSDYQVKETKEIAINLANLKQILRRSKPSESLTLELGADNKLHVTLKSNSTRTFSLPLIETEEKEQRVPQLDFPLHITTHCDHLNEAIEDVGIVAESVTFVTESDKFTLRAEGDVSKAQIEIPGGGDTVIALKGGRIKAKYSIEYLKKMMNGSKLTDTVEIFYNQDYPLKLEYKVVDKVMLSFILAPRVEND